MHKVGLVVCGNEENIKKTNDEDILSIFPNFPIINLILCIIKQKGWHSRLLNVQNKFTNDELQREVYVRTIRRIDNHIIRRSHILYLQRSLFGLKGAVHTFHQLVTAYVHEGGPIDLQNAPCMFMNNGLAIIC